MLKIISTLLIAFVFVPVSLLFEPEEPKESKHPEAPMYTSDAKLQFPQHYREWVFLSSGVGMTYGPMAGMNQPASPTFDNVFVNPDSYRAFLATGHWPDKTVFVLEVRGSETHGSINRGGHFQRDLVGIEAEVKDESAPSGKWTFYGFSLVPGAQPTSAPAFPRTAACYSCHAKNAAVENTFVQFYPALYDVAETKGTFNQTFDPLPPTTSNLFELVRAHGWSAAKASLEDTAKRSPDAGVLNEAPLNLLGYRFLQADDPKDAISLLSWVADRYPKSANAQDSLADAYLAAKDNANARATTERSLALAKTDPSLSPQAKEQLTKSAQDRLKKTQ